MSGDDVFVLVNGGAFTGWLEVDVDVSFDKAFGEGTLKISEQPGIPFPVRLGDAVQVICGSTPALTGYAREVNGEHDYNSHTISLKLKDKSADFVQSTLGPGHEFKPPVKLKQVLDTTLKKMGLSSIQVIDKVNPPEYGPAELPVGAVDQTGFGFADMWTRKRQVVLNPDGKGNINIDRNQKRRGSGALIKAFEDSPVNNVLKAKYKISDENRANTTGCASQKSPNDRDYWESRPKDDKPAQAKPLSTQWGVAFDTEVRSELKRHFRGGDGHNADSPKKSARWRSNLARARGFEYTATVQGFEMSPGQLWWPGFIIPVRDDHFEISDELFISRVHFHKDFGGGATTEVTCTYGDAFSESEGGTASRSAKRGKGYSGVGAYPPDDTSNLEE